MILPRSHQRPAGWAALAALAIALATSLPLAAQSPAQPAPNLASIPAPEPAEIALPLAEDRGQAAAEQALRRLSTTASLMMIVAHPDDEDGALLTYLSRGLGVRCTLLTLTRGEGGQNAMSADADDTLGILRTHELLKAGQFYGAKQLWGTEADFGFSKTQDEAFALWGRQRVLYDAVLAVRRERPQIIVSTFVGGITDGHGHHQVSGEIAQEVFKSAADPSIFPDQLKDGLQPWQPLAVYSMVPFAPITEKGMFDYATGKWAPAKFKNYVTGEVISGQPSTDVTLPVGKWDPILGRSYVQIAREGWGEQKSQNGGSNPTLSGPGSTSYHLWAIARGARPAQDWIITTNDNLFLNSKVQIGTSLEDLAFLVNGIPPDWLFDGLRGIDAGLKSFQSSHKTQSNLAAAHTLAHLYQLTLALRTRVADGNFGPKGRASLLFELDLKIDQFQSTLKELLGLDLAAFTTKADSLQAAGPFRGGSADETPRSVQPSQQFRVRVHTSSADSAASLARVWLDSRTGDPWQTKDTTGTGADRLFQVTASENAEPTQPYFTRPSIAQPYYDISPPEDRLRSFAPYPLSAWAEFTFDGLPIRIGQVVQTLQRVVGPGGVYQPLVVEPAIGLRIEPSARILPPDGSALPVRVTVHTQRPADGTVELKLPAGWTSDPPQAAFHRTTAGDAEPLLFRVTPATAQAGSYAIQAVAHSANHDYATGWQSVGYPGLLPYNQFHPARLNTRKVDLKLAPGLRVAYVMGPGDLVPDALEGLGLTPHLLTAAELAQADLSPWNVIVIGIRAYTTRPELAANQERLNTFVRGGGTLVVQYQGADFPAPLPVSMGRAPERVVDEQAPVKLLEPSNPLLNWPNAITPADFDGWVEERGHGFPDHWDPAYAALTETADPGQDHQRGGLLVTHPGKGTYIYVAFALYRQFPELVSGAYRLFANLLSAGQQPASH